MTSHLKRAKEEKNDEFYTPLEAIEKELEYYTDQLEDKTVLCNCDDPDMSKFYEYFYKNFRRLKLRRLFCTHYAPESYAAEYDGESLTCVNLKGDGDFRSDEVIEYLKRADVVITNPPFSLSREFIDQLVRYDKKFLIVGCKTWIGYKEIFPLIRDRRISLGRTDVRYFYTPTGETKMFGNVCWFTNLTPPAIPRLNLTARYNPVDYPKYDNANAIEVGRVKDIPKYYSGVMGVPITFTEKYCPEQFEIVGYRKGTDGKDLRIDGKDKFTRILIKRRVV